MDAYVADARGGVRGRLDGVSEEGLSDMGEADASFPEMIQELGGVPGAVPDLDDEGEVTEAVDQVVEPGARLVGVPEGPGELQEHGPEAACLRQGVQAGSCLPHLGPRPSLLALMGEAAPELGGEAEVRVVANPFGPPFRNICGSGAVEGSVDLDRTEVAGEKGEGVEPFRLWLRVDDPCPVVVGPACRADADHVPKLSLGFRHGRSGARDAPQTV